MEGWYYIIIIYKVIPKISMKYMNNKILSISILLLPNKLLKNKVSRIGLWVMTSDFQSERPGSTPGYDFYFIYYLF